MKTFQVYPSELERIEAEAIAQRRAIVDGPARDPTGPEITAGGTQENAPPAPAGPPPAESDLSTPGGFLPLNTVGLALSGGGIRSATFCLGFLQAMAKRGVLKHVDILSTVSGGGYIGGFLGRFYDRLRSAPAQAPDVVESTLSKTSSGPVRWLRDHGQYIAPAGKSDLETEFAIFLRNFLTLQLTLGTLVFGVYGLANLFRYGLADKIVSLLPYLGSLNWSEMPIGRLVTTLGFGAFWSPWFMLVELMIWLRLVPLGLAYWLASQDEDEGFSRPTLVILFLLIFAFLYIGVRNGLNLLGIGGAVAVLLAIPAVESAWRRVRREFAAVGSGGARIQQVRARTHLSRDLGTWIRLTAALIFFAVIDTLARGVYEWKGRGNEAFIQTFAKLSAGLIAVLPILRGVTHLIAESPSSKSADRGGVARLLSRPAISAVLAILLLAPPIFVVAFVSHAAFGGGDAVCRGILIAAFTLVLSLVIALPWAVMLINRSSLQSTYAAKLARAFLGATSPNRVNRGADDVLPGDDVDVFTDYRPHAAGGPLHLINVCVNQTVDENTLRSGRARQGVGMACSSLGISIDRYFHARWNLEYKPVPRNAFGRNVSSAGSAQPLQAVGHVPGTAHPLLGADGEPPDWVDSLPLRDWIAISGAAFGPGMGRSTNPALSVLFLLANLRVGYWWNSGLTAGDRGTRPQVSFFRRILWLLPKLFETQTRLLAEATAQFRGPWDRLWYLSDGGHYENLGGYELIRRRVPFIIMLDAGTGMEDFADFERMVRIDFQAEIEPLGQKQWESAVQAQLKDIGDLTRQAAEAAKWNALIDHIAVADGQGGPLDVLFNDAKDAASSAGCHKQPSRKHASLFRVKHDLKHTSLVLYVRASLTGDEPADVMQYHAANPTFPQQSTADQFFDEPQWESYRRLGEHVGASVLGPETATPTLTQRDGLWITRIGRTNAS